MSQSDKVELFYCPNCGRFFDESTYELVDIPYTDMPAEFAIQVMIDRQQSRNLCHPPWWKRKAKKPARGFGNK